MENFGSEVLRTSDSTQMILNLPARVPSALLLLVVLGVAGCSTSQRRPVEAPPAKPPYAQPRPSASAPVSTQDYFQRATAISLFEVRASDLALQRASGPARALALKSRQQHSAVAAQLSYAGRRLNMLPSQTLPPEYRQMLDTLVSTPDFNSTYLTQQRIVTRRAFDLHSTYARTGKSPTLRPVAEFAVRTLVAK